MKKNNIYILNEIINVLQNHIEYNVTDLLTTHSINDDGSIDYDIKFTLEDSDKEEKEQLKREQEAQKPVINVEYNNSPVESVREPISEVEDVIPAPIHKKGKKERKRCGNCKYYDDVKKNSCTLYDKETSSWTMLDISDCFEDK
jgi:hypothetical protein